MMKQYMKNKSLFLQKEELLSRIAELFSKKILRPSGVLVFLLITCLGLFSCSKFLEENPKDKLPEDDVYNTISDERPGWNVQADKIITLHFEGL